MSETTPAATGKNAAADDRSRRPPVMRAPAHRGHAALGAVFEMRGAWEVPASYASQPREAEALRSGLAIADVTARGKLHLSGSIDPMLRHLTGGELESQRTAATKAGDRVARIARDWALALLRPSTENELLRALQAETAEDSMATDVTSAMAGYLVAGQGLETLFARTLTLDFRDIQPGRCLAARWAKIPAVLVVLELGVPAVELYVGSEFGRYAWSTLVELGGHLGAVPVGWRALEAWGWK
jgi:glycine cleavage system aminomethyltransferase T